MRMLESKKLEHKPAMKKLADVKPEEGRRAEQVNNIIEIKALEKRVRYLETEVVMLVVALVATAICAAL